MMDAGGQITIGLMIGLGIIPVAIPFSRAISRCNFSQLFNQARRNRADRLRATVNFKTSVHSTQLAKRKA